jgi:hypothetical protein
MRIVLNNTPLRLEIKSTFTLDSIDPDYRYARPWQALYLPGNSIAAQCRP